MRRWIWSVLPRMPGSRNSGYQRSIGSSRGAHAALVQKSLHPLPDATRRARSAARLVEITRNLAGRIERSPRQRLAVRFRDFRTTWKLLGRS